MLKDARSELAELQEFHAVQKRRAVDVLHVLLRDLSDMGTAVCVLEIKTVHEHVQFRHLVDFWPLLCLPHALCVVGMWGWCFFRRRVLSGSSFPHKAQVWIEKPHQSHQTVRVHPWAHFIRGPGERERASVPSRTRLSGDAADVPSQALNSGAVSLSSNWFPYCLCAKIG